MFRPIVSVLCLFSVTLIAQTDISKAFVNGNVDGEVELFYYKIDKKGEENTYATALGGFVKYSTDTKNPFFASLRLHTSNPVGSNLNRVKTSLFDANGDALNTISESYIAYRTKQRVMRLGNFMLKAPMINDDTTRIVPWSYQGFTYTGDVIEDVRVQVHYINAMRSNTSSKYEKKSASGEIGDSGITMLSFHYNGVEGMHLQSYYYYAPELYSTFIAQSEYEFLDVNDVHHCIGVQYFNSSDGGKYADTYSRNGGDDIDLLALRIAVDTENWLVSLNYSKNFGVSGIVKGYGGLAKVYTSSMIANGRGNYKPETWMLKTKYEFPIASYNSEIAFNFTNTKVHEKREDDFNAYYVHFKHYFNEDTSIYLRYENMNYLSDKSDASYFRAIATYRF